MSFLTIRRKPQEIGLLKTDFRQPRHCIGIPEATPGSPPVPIDLDDAAGEEHLQGVQDFIRANAKEPERDRLSEIASLVRSLTYGEMTELAAAIWRAKPDEGELNNETLPGTLHRWATT